MKSCDLKYVCSFIHELPKQSLSRYYFLGNFPEPEELVKLLFEKVLKLDPFIILRTLKNKTVNKSLLYQIFPGELKKSPLPPTVQELLELSMMESGQLFDEVGILDWFVLLILVINLNSWQEELSETSRSMFIGEMCVVIKTNNGPLAT